MTNLIAVVFFILGFILEILGATLGVVTPLACVLAGLTFLALSTVSFGVLKKHVSNR